MVVTWWIVVFLRSVCTPILVVVSAVNASYLGKNGAVSHLFRVLCSCQRKHLTLIKYCLDALAQLVKSSKYMLVSRPYAITRLTARFVWPDV